MNEIYDKLLDILPVELADIIMKEYMLIEIRKAKNNNDYEMLITLLKDKWNHSLALRILHGNFELADIENLY